MSHDNSSPIGEKIFRFGNETLKLLQFEKKIHLPTTVGIDLANCMVNLANNNTNECNALINFNPKKIELFADIGCGTGHLCISADKLYSNLKKVYAIDLLKSCCEHTKYNWKFNQCHQTKLETIQGSVDHIFQKNQNKFDFIVCNPPNLGLDAPLSGFNGFFFFGFFVHFQKKLVFTFVRFDTIAQIRGFHEHIKHTSDMIAQFRNSTQTTFLFVGRMVDLCLTQY